MLIFAEITTKTISALYPEKIAFPANFILKSLLKLLYPVVWTADHMFNTLARVVGFNPGKAGDDGLSKGELRTVVDESSDNIAGQQDMLINVLDLGSVTVNDIMAPHNEIVGLDLEQDEIFAQNSLSKVPMDKMPNFAFLNQSGSGTFFRDSRFKEPLNKCRYLLAFRHLRYQGVRLQEDWLPFIVWRNADNPNVETVNYSV